MKALINGVTYEKSYESKKAGTLYLFKIQYDGKTGFYSSKKRDQNKFVANQECEFTETPMKSGDKTWTKLSPVYQNKNFSNYSRAVKKEQSKYSGFAMAYAKDLLVAGKISSLSEMYLEAQNMIDWMVLKDKELES